MLDAVASPARSARRAEGLSLRFLWGDRLLAEHFLPPASRRGFSVGAGADFPLVDRRLPGGRFELARPEDEGFVLRWPRRVDGSFWREGSPATVEGLVDAGAARAESGLVELALERGDVAVLRLGGLAVEAQLREAPARVRAGSPRDMDYTLPNALLILLLLAGLFAVNANVRAQESEAAEPAMGPSAQVRKIAYRIERKGRPPAPEAAAGSSGGSHRGAEGKAGAPKEKAAGGRLAVRPGPGSGDGGRRAVQALFGGGAFGLLGGGGGLGKELDAALGQLKGSRAGASAGALGLGFLGNGDGGGGLSEGIGVGPLRTRGRGGGLRGYGAGPALGPEGDKPQPQLDPDPPVVCGGPELACGLDKDLIRKVIHDHRSQIRYCYEVSLQGRPDLAGKVSVRFLIGADGAVKQSDVAATSVGDLALERCVASKVLGWQFPRPKTGGVVVVTYPFLFKPSGS